MKLQRKMYEANKALSYFVTHNWHFKNDNFINLNSSIKCEDWQSFEFQSFLCLDVILLLRKMIYGFRKFLLNLKDEDLERDRITMKRIKQGLFIFEMFFFCFIGYILLKTFY
jgi:Male sterility protein